MTYGACKDRISWHFIEVG